MNVECIGVHESVQDIFPATRLRDALTSAATNVAVVSDDTLDDCDAIVTLTYSDIFLESDVRWIHSVQSGIDRFPFDDLTDNSIILTNSVGIHRACVGDSCVGYVTALSRGFDTYVRNQSAHRWERPDWDETFTLADETACVIGLGTLGRGVAERLDALGMRVTGVRRRPNDVPHVETVFGSDDFLSAIEDAKFVVLAVPLTDETEALIDTEALGTMRTDAFVVNVARGPVVDQAALIEAIKADEIAGAALDVFETEPLPTDSPLWDLDRVMVTPHAAGLYRDYYADVAEIVAENVRLFRDGDELRNRVQ